MRYRRAVFKFQAGPFIHLGWNTLPTMWRGSIDKCSECYLSSNSRRVRFFTYVQIHVRMRTVMSWITVRNEISESCVQILVGSVTFTYVKYHSECAVPNERCSVRDNTSESDIGKQSSISCRVRYIYLDTNTLAKMRCCAIDNGLEWDLVFYRVNDIHLCKCPFECICEFSGLASRLPKKKRKTTTRKSSTLSLKNWKKHDQLSVYHVYPFLKFNIC